MSQENVELAYRAAEAFNRRDLDAFLALMDDDVEIASRIVVIEGGLRGHDGARRWWQNWLDTWPDYKVEVVEVRDAGDVTLAALRALGHGAGSEVPFEDTAWQLGRWRARKCIAWRIFTDRAEALEAAGLSE
jgi:ketosteroid isomerase-like protein